MAGDAVAAPLTVTDGDGKWWAIATPLACKVFPLQQRFGRWSVGGRAGERERGTFLLCASDSSPSWGIWRATKLTQLAPVSQRGRVEGRGNTGGINAAVRELGIDRTEAQRAVKIASITDEAKEAARAAGLDDNQSALRPDKPLVRRNGEGGEWQSPRFVAFLGRLAGRWGHFEGVGGKRYFPAKASGVGPPLAAPPL